VSLLKLRPPIYPAVARQTRVAGDVEVSIEINSDGTIAWAEVVQGHPLLSLAAIDSAKGSKFACHDCVEETIKYSLIYSFKLDGPFGCEIQTQQPNLVGKPELQYPRVTMTENHVTITDRYVPICDPGPDPIHKMRSAKCLFLWNCATTTRAVTPKD